MFVHRKGNIVCMGRYGQKWRKQDKDLADLNCLNAQKFMLSSMLMAPLSPGCGPVGGCHGQRGGRDEAADPRQQGEDAGAHRRQPHQLPLPRPAHGECSKYYSASIQIFSRLQVNVAEAESSGSSKHATSRQVRTGRLYMIDLAGSERAANTKVTLRY